MRTEPAPGPDPARFEPAAVAALAAAVVLFSLLMSVAWEFVTDDAYISLRYARNFARGFGPVWNPGGDVVEGFSNPLYVYAEALVYWLGGNGVVFARAAGVLSGLGLIVTIWWAGHVVLGRFAASVAAVLVAASPGLAYWTVGGLETLPMALVITAAALILARPGGGSALGAGVLLALLPWIRPEGLAIAGALVFFSEIGGLLDRGRRRATIGRLVWLAGLPLLSQALLQALRWAFYRHLLPNSVIYKSGTGEFGEVTIKFLLETAPLWPLAVLGLFVVPARARLLAAPAAVYLVASLTFLDSVNLFSRLLLPVFPLVALLAGAGTASLLRVGASGGHRRWVAPVAVTLTVAALMVVVMPGNVGFTNVQAADYMSCKHVARQEGGEWLAQRLRPGDAYVIGDAGVLPYYADGHAVDLFGLNDPRLQELGPTSARERANRALEAHPRFFVLSSKSPESLDHHYTVERVVRRDDRFDGYERVFVAGPDDSPCDYYLHIFESQSA